CWVLLTFRLVRADDEIDVDVPGEEELGKSGEGSRTDDEVVQREEEAIQLDGVNASLEKFAFQAEVNKMMKLKLVSDASSALDKIRLLSLTDENALSGNEELTVKIKCDEEKNLLPVTDTGVGMTRVELVKNLDTIAKSGTSEFVNKMNEAQADGQSPSELIGQFVVVIVTSKHNDTQHIWESDCSEFSVIADPRGNTLGQGTTITLVLKEEGSDYLESDTIKNLIKKYSQFINFPVHVWSIKTETVEEPMEEEAAAKEEKEESDEEAAGEEEEKKKPKTKKVGKTRPSKEVEGDEYKAFYKSFSKESDDSMAYIHFTAEGEVTFKSILFVPASAVRGLFDENGSKKSDYIKVYVRHVFITDDFHDRMPKYLNFVKGVVDSDGLSLNASLETLQQHKPLNVIRKKFVRNTLDMIKKILGVIEDHSNRTRLTKLLRFQSSHHPVNITSLDQYVEKMKEKQDKIYLMARSSRKRAEFFPFIERLLKKGYGVIYLTESVGEYCIQALSEFEGKRFQNVAKEAVKFDESEKTKKSHEGVEKEFEPLLNWMKDKALKDKIEKAVYGWSGNMERIMKAQAYQMGKDISTNYYVSQKKTFEINPRHPLIRDEDEDDKTALDLAVVLFEAAMLLIERMLYLTEDTTEDTEQEEDKEMDVGTDEEEQETAKESTAEKDEL
uniref:Histidine kinase/HSP90-like ATPase domain-containing protein n=1 Tax=Aotus nancymaae TaxID=37293 RepID=A0A2K5DY85_AOTNA